jgi:hypothetical protein
LGFFGLPNNYSVLLHTQIFELCYYGNGFTQEGIYKLPVHIRMFYYRQLADAKKKEADAQKKSQKQTQSSSPKGPNVRVRK